MVTYVSKNIDILFGPIYIYMPSALLFHEFHGLNINEKMTGAIIKCSCEVVTCAICVISITGAINLIIHQ